MINLRCVSQPQFPEGFVEGAVGDLWEPWMREADQLLDDDQLLNVVYDALVRRAPKSRTFGRLGVPAEIVVRMLLLKHLRNWSFDELEREVRPNLLYREFTRVAAGIVPDAKTLARQARALGPEAIKQIHQRVVALAVENKVVQGRKLRVDTTVVETNIHFPTDSSLLDDGNRVLTRLMKKVRRLSGTLGTKLRDRSRSVKRRVLDIARAARSKASQSQEKMNKAYSKLLASMGRVVGQAKRFAQEIANGVKRATSIRQQAALEVLRREIDTMVPRVQQVIKQTKARIFKGNTHAEGKLFSIFETATEIIRKGKAGKPNEFGKMVKVQEGEGQVVIDFQVYDQRPADSDVLIAAIEIHQQVTGRTPDMTAGDAGFYSAKNVAIAKQMGVKRVSVPSRSTKSAALKREQKKRWFKKGQKWRTGCEGRISVLKRRHGLNRCRYKGRQGMIRWTGLGVIADNLINIGRAIDKRKKSAK
jgi:IS5 family transposase